ncbi:hypothetical protein FB451DRAFT_1419646 [Mycena latifolia]|nr:hypothetical protein FB451DRAFT_1419646 [Mycena latifolia]
MPSTPSPGVVGIMTLNLLRGLAKAGTILKHSAIYIWLQIYNTTVQVTRPSQSETMTVQTRHPRILERPKLWLFDSRVLTFIDVRNARNAVCLETDYNRTPYRDCLKYSRFPIKSYFGSVHLLRPTSSFTVSARLSVAPTFLHADFTPDPFDGVSSVREDIFTPVSNSFIRERIGGTRVAAALVGAGLRKLKILRPVLKLRPRTSKYARALVRLSPLRHTARTCSARDEEGMRGRRVKEAAHAARTDFTVHARTSTQAMARPHWLQPRGNPRDSAARGRIGRGAGRK